MDLHHPDHFFASSYLEARERFVTAAGELGARLSRYPIHDQQHLTIDVAVVAPDCKNAVVVSSGVHGVEGAFGSAVQLAWLTRVLRHGLPADVSLVMIHAVNPYGFAHGRRWNEDGVDLNRNFLIGADDYSGAPDGYVRLNRLLNPQSPPSRLEPFRVIAAYYVARYGLSAIRAAIASGQFEYPRGLFYGGSGPSSAMRIFADHYRSWMGDADHIVHLDLHTGLGRFGQYRLLLDRDQSIEDQRWIGDVFGRHVVEPLESGATAYPARGTLGNWAIHQMSDRTLRFAVAEFGTFNSTRVLAALRAENRVHHFAADQQRYDWVRQELRECFCPSSLKWRRDVLASGMNLIETSVHAVGQNK